jgi:iron complex outermembrane receptor protein
MNDWNFMGQKQVIFEKTNILMSPSVVGMASLTFGSDPYATITGKYVGKQYYDNTSSDERSIPAYFVANLSLGYGIFSLHVNNLFNHQYFADAWLWRAYFAEEDEYYAETGIYPQAPINIMLKISWKF